MNEPIAISVRVLKERHKAEIIRLERDIAFYRCCALSGEIPDNAQRPSARESKYNG